MKTLQELFSDPSKWTQRAYARDAAGRGLPEWSPEAVCWCLDGAIRKIYGRTNQQKIWDFLNEKHNSNPITLNDTNNASFSFILDIAKEIDLWMSQQQQLQQQQNQQSQSPSEVS